MVETIILREQDTAVTTIRTTPGQGRIDTLTVVVREDTPFLPKVAFALITLASLAGVTFTSSGMGLTWTETGQRWLTLWSTALAGGFLAWRVAYLRPREDGADDRAVAALNRTALGYADRLGRWVALAVILGAPGAVLVPVTGSAVTVALVAGAVLLSGLLLAGVSRPEAAWPAAFLVTGLLLGWSWLDAGPGWPLVLRLAHLLAFALWIGGALWNIGVAMRAGRSHPTVDAVLAGARQLDRFRWVVRFALPTIIVTGLVMAGAYRALPLSWWTSFPGVLIPLKVLAVVALVVVFITCPLFRHCSPVQGVCDLDDLDRP
jgi:putative copper resistance protein D